VEQRVVVTFSGSNGGWDYAADVNYSKNTNDNRNTGGYRMKPCSKPPPAFSTP